MHKIIFACIGRLHDYSVCFCVLLHWITWLNSRHLNSSTNFFSFVSLILLCTFDWSKSLLFGSFGCVSFLNLNISPFHHFIFVWNRFEIFKNFHKQFEFRLFLFVVKLRSKSIHWIKRFERRKKTLFFFLPNSDSEAPCLPGSSPHGHAAVHTQVLLKE